MNARMGSLLLCVFAMGSGLAAVACGPATNEPPSEVPKSSRPPDRTEVTMEVSSATPPGEVAPPTSPPPSASAKPSAGPSAATAPAKEPAEDATIGGAQTDPVVEKAVAPVRPRLRACYKKALAVEPTIAGGATFDATLGKDGHVSSARFVKRDGLNEDMVGCLLAAVKAMSFDAGRTSQIVTLSFGGTSTPVGGPKH